MLYPSLSLAVVPWSTLEYANAGEPWSRAEYYEVRRDHECTHARWPHCYARSRPAVAVAAVVAGDVGARVAAMYMEIYDIYICIYVYIYVYIYIIYLQNAAWCARAIALH
jgi:hypothetical protein